jgi:hypothetical protein
VLGWCIAQGRWQPVRNDAKRDSTVSIFSSAGQPDWAAWRNAHARLARASRLSASCAPCCPLSQPCERLWTCGPPECRTLADFARGLDVAWAEAGLVLLQDLSKNMSVGTVFITIAESICILFRVRMRMA